MLFYLCHLVWVLGLTIEIDAPLRARQVSSSTDVPSLPASFNSGNFLQRGDPLPQVSLVKIATPESDYPTEILTAPEDKTTVIAWWNANIIGSLSGLATIEALAENWSHGSRVNIISIEASIQSDLTPEQRHTGFSGDNDFVEL